MNRAVLFLLGSVLLVVGLVAVLMQGERSGGSGSITSDPSRAATGEASPAAQSPLLVYCAASNRAVIEAIVADYKQEYGVSVELQYGASQTLLSSMSVSGTGDLFLPADNSYIDMAREKGLVAEVLPLARMHAVVAVPKGNPKGILALDDLLKPDNRVIQARPDSAAIGKLTQQVLTAQGLWDKLEKATTAFRPTVNDVASDVVVGAADATIVYDAVLHTYPKLESIELPELKEAVSEVSLAVVKSTTQARAALHFARYVAARDRGQKRYAEYGFQPIAGDQWSDRPELSIFAGSMLRPAIERTIIAFEQREGVKVSRVYNGCGILVAQMKSGQHPDAYFACDKEFMNSLPDLFPTPVEVSQNELVILVQKGNPHGVKHLRDLGQPGLRVGVGHEKQCAMGWLTQNTLREGGVEKEVMANVTVQSPTGDMLVNQMQAGSLDAAVVYLSNAAGAGEKLDAIRIVGLPCSIAVQPFAIANDSPHAQLASRLLQRIQSLESKETFLAEGFRWSEDLKSAVKTSSDSSAKLGAEPAESK